MSVLVHIDDVGATESATRRVLDAWQNGFIDGFSILANGEALNIVQSQLVQQKNRPITLGVHLNLCEGKALGHTSLITGENGFFKYGFGGILWQWLRSGKSRKRSLLNQIENEWRIQIRKVKEICAPRKIDTLDGHIHIHMLPMLFPLAVKLARAEAIAGIRISSEIFYVSGGWIENISKHFLINTLKHVILKGLSFSARSIAYKTGLQAPDAIVGVLYTGMMTRAAARDGIRKAQMRGAKKIEVVFHIGRANEVEARRWRMSKEEFQSQGRDREYKELIAFRKTF